MKKIGLVVKADPQAEKTADKFQAWLTGHSMMVVRREPFNPGEVGSADRNDPYTGNAPADLSCVFVLGGDGTFISAVRWIGDQPIAVLGVKFGDLGFLAETTAENLYPVARAVLDNQLTIRPRMRLVVRVLRDEKEILRETVLNDVVINRGALARLADIITYIDNQYLTTYRADGLIVATPTGSTAYSLAAGGPIIHPNVQGTIITPICPFTLTNRPLIVPDNAAIKIRLEKRAEGIALTLDGQLGMAIDQRDTIIVTKSNHPVQMIGIPDRSYFDVLKTKLRWSGGQISKEGETG
ncbi:MAG: NAD(+) kinase [Deltaproteobacteria bacterium]|nr:MAG: NAD(+) kinase [Deltaproteobacteria bacterium]